MMGRECDLVVTLWVSFLCDCGIGGGCKVGGG